jgi:hypothetical protein
MAYLLCIFGGIIIGMIISRFLPARIQIKGKIKQKGRGNNLVVKPDKKSEKKPRKRLLKRRNK